MADEYYAIKPGTDLAVALAIIKVIVDNQLYQTDFLRDYTDAGALIDVDTKERLVDAQGTWLAWSQADGKPASVNNCNNMAFDGGPFTFVHNGRQVKAKPVLQLLQEMVRITP